MAEYENASSSRCTICLVNWPPTYKYVTCPECGGDTRASREPPMDEAEVQSRENHAAFERWLEDNNRL